MFGFLNVKKPVGVTSRDVVNRVQRLIRPVKVGHTGTLDPLASGVLVLAIGPATRLAKYLLHHSKHYRGQFQLGCSSPTDDTEVDLTYLSAAPKVSEAEMVAVLPRFRGTIRQRPPAYSAVKVNGQRSYRLARKGEDVELPEREVTIHELELSRFQTPEFELKIHCSGGTYVRALGRDIGTHLGSAAVMTGLIRTGVGRFLIRDSLDFDAIDQSAVRQNLLSPLECLPDISQVTVGGESLKELSVGRSLKLDKTCDLLAAVDDKGRLIALMVHKEGEGYRPSTNFVHYWIQGDHQSNDSS